MAADFIRQAAKKGWRVKTTATSLPQQRPNRRGIKAVRNVCVGEDPGGELAFFLFQFVDALLDGVLAKKLVDLTDPVGMIGGWSFGRLISLTTPRNDHFEEFDSFRLLVAFARFASVGKRGRKSNAQTCRRREPPSFCTILAASSRSRATSSVKPMLDPVSG